MYAHIILLGPEMPEPLYGMGSVQYGNTFALVGGFYSGYKDTTYVYNPTSGLFDLLEDRLSSPRVYVTAFLVNEDIFPEC